MSFIQEFKEFAIKGNVIDMAVGVVIGVAFNAIVNSLVNDIIMPPIGYALGGMEFKDLQWVLRPAGVDDAGAGMPEVAVRYGQFINVVIQFFIIALSAFVVVRTMNRVIRARDG